MPKANNTDIFIFDTNITENDYLFGTDGDAYKRNKSYSVMGLVNLINTLITGESNSLIPLNFKYTKGSLRKGYFQSNVDKVGDLLTFRISEENIEKYNLTPFFTLINGNLDKFYLNLTVTNKPNINAYYTLKTVTPTTGGYTYAVERKGNLTTQSPLIEEKSYRLNFVYSDSNNNGNNGNDQNNGQGLRNHRLLKLTANVPFEYHLPMGCMLFALQPWGEQTIKIGSSPTKTDDLGEFTTTNRGIIQLGLMPNYRVWLTSNKSAMVDTIIYKGIIRAT